MTERAEHIEIMPQVLEAGLRAYEIYAESAPDILVEAVLKSALDVRRNSASDMDLVKRISRMVSEWEDSGELAGDFARRLITEVRR